MTQKSSAASDPAPYPAAATELECLALDWLSKIRPFRLFRAGKMMIWLFRAGKMI